jgi:rod shape-determining protein MreB
MSIINSVLGYFSYDIGIDLGTANTLVFVEGKGIAIREPSVVARHKKTKEVIAIGSSAKKMVGRAPSHIETIRPLKDGVIADFDATQAMLALLSFGFAKMSNPATSSIFYKAAGFVVLFFAFLNIYLSLTALGLLPSVLNLSL